MKEKMKTQDTMKTSKRKFGTRISGIAALLAIGLSAGAQTHPAHQHPPNATPEAAGPAHAVFDSYLKIQTALAADAMHGLSANAAAIARAVQADADKSLPADLAKQAETLAKASDIKAAREAFKPLSDSLIKYLAANKAHRGHYVQVYCPMANARWLQTGTVVNNPYFGKSMARCGKIEG